jgi:hypothetical protein
MLSAESGSVGDLDEVIATAERVATEWGSLGLMRWGRFTRAMGGSAVLDFLHREFVGPAYRRGNPKPRYLYTCRCGMIDFRHFFDLLPRLNSRCRTSERIRSITDRDE